MAFCQYPAPHCTILCVPRQGGKIISSVNCNLALWRLRPPWLSLWESWLPRKGQTERASRRDFGCYYLTAVPSQSACSADSSPRGRAKGSAGSSALNYNLPLLVSKTRRFIKKPEPDISQARLFTGAFPYDRIGLPGVWGPLPPRRGPFFRPLSSFSPRLQYVRGGGDYALQAAEKN